MASKNFQHSRESIMILGIDVGGTHTDAVLLENFQVRKKSKVVTNKDNILESLLNATTELLRDEAPGKLKRIVLSTTVSTNAIVQNKTDRVGMILINGPGLSASHLKINEDTHFISGYVNHRGMEVAGIDNSELITINQKLKNEGIFHAGIVGKFSTRNPAQELLIRKHLDESLKHVSLGHRMSGHLNYPRRVATTYLNEATWSTYNNYITQVVEFVRKKNINVPIYILKADGGTFDINQSLEYPVETILSGPSASIMGILSMTNPKEDAIALDIGGTTTDIAIFADGAPLLEAQGVQIDRYKTLIRGLLTKSIGIGGDSRIQYVDNRLKIGPEREGMAAALGGPYPTPTDAMIILGLTDLGNREKAENALSDISGQMNVSLEETAKAILEETCQKIVFNVKEMLNEINNKPVYTIHELLEGKTLAPKTAYVVGGPAEAMAPRLGELLNCRIHIPQNAEVANAIGAALARTTAEITILADTEQKIMAIGEEGHHSSISSRFSRQDAIRIGREKLKEKAIRMGANEEDIEIEVVESQEFNMVKGFYTSGKNIRIKLQIKPGLISGARMEDTL